MKLIGESPSAPRSEPPNPYQHTDVTCSPHRSALPTMIPVQYHQYDDTYQNNIIRLRYLTASSIPTLKCYQISVIHTPANSGYCTYKKKKNMNERKTKLPPLPLPFIATLLFFFPSFSSAAAPLYHPRLISQKRLPYANSIRHNSKTHVPIYIPMSEKRKKKS